MSNWFVFPNHNPINVDIEQYQQLCVSWTVVIGEGDGVAVFAVRTLFPYVPYDLQIKVNTWQVNYMQLALICCATPSPFTLVWNVSASLLEAGWDTGLWTGISRPVWRRVFCGADRLTWVC